MPSVEPPPVPPIVQAEDKDAKPPVFLIVANAALLLLIDTILLFVIPVFAEIFSGFGTELPLPTQGLIDLAAFLKSTFVLFNPQLIITVAFVIFLSREHPSRSLLKWAALIQILLLVAIGLCMILPIFQLGTVAGSL